MKEKEKDPQKELEIAIGELEARVDRLRASYEQYFMGYEKIEPGVQRKDVDRRFAALRKLQIRNTALRFRFNVVTQKFNTYAMYWTRVCRQIEDGTYRRHVAKARRRFEGAAEPAEPHTSAIDVELDDFGDVEVDVEAVLAEVNAAVEARAHAVQLEVTGPRRPEPPPRGQPDNRPPHAHRPDASAHGATAASVPPHHLRPASLPVGAKHVVIRRSMRSDPDLSAAAPHSVQPSGPSLAAPAQPMGALSHPAPASSAVRPHRPPPARPAPPSSPHGAPPSNPHEAPPSSPQGAPPPYIPATPPASRPHGAPPMIRKIGVREPADAGHAPAAHSAHEPDAHVAPRPPVRPRPGGPPETHAPASHPLREPKT